MSTLEYGLMILLVTQSLAWLICDYQDYDPDAETTVFADTSNMMED